MKNNEKVVIIYAENSENFKDKILKIFEKYLETNMSRMGWQIIFLYAIMSVKGIFFFEEEKMIVKDPKVAAYIRL